MNKILLFSLPWITLFILGAVVVFIKLIGKRQSYSYKKKGPYLLNAAEKHFFESLAQVTDSDLYICPKVRIADILEVDLSKNDSKYWTAFNQISQKHVDFVICRQSDFSPMLVIELDGDSHRSNARIKRDAFIDAAFKQANIPTLHIQTQDVYQHDQLKLAIREAKQV